MLSKKAEDLLRHYDQSALTELYKGGYIDGNGITEKGLEILNKGKLISDIKELAIKLKELWPKGSRSGIPWTEATQLIQKRLNQFFVKYGEQDFDRIYDAAKRYTSMPAWKEDNTYMLSLKNFIFNDTLGVAGTVDEKSTLLTFMEDMDANMTNLSYTQFQELR